MYLTSKASYLLANKFLWDELLHVRFMHFNGEERVNINRIDYSKCFHKWPNNAYRFCLFIIVIIICIIIITQGKKALPCLMMIRVCT